ncbi:MAG: response regulator [Rhodocyclaceae bacterium]|nr:response regulator [Rhodocyclaceae bacterium]
MDRDQAGRDSKVEAMLVEAHLRQHRYILPVSVFISTMLLVLLREAYPSPAPLFLWWLAVLALTGWRALSVRQWRQAPDPGAEALAMRPRLIVEATFAGLLWGLLGSVLCPPPDSGLSVISAVALMGVGSSGLVSLSPLLPAYMGFFAAMLLPSVAGYAVRDTYLEHLIAITLAIFMVSLYINGRRIERNLRETLQLQLDLEASAERAEASRQEADAANLAKSMFLATMSHEIRTPMNGVLGMAQLLGRSTLDERQRKFLGTLQDSGQHLLRLLDEILDFSKIEAGRLELAPTVFSPAELVDQLASLMRPRASDRGLALAVHIERDLPEWLVGDAHRVRQIITNLLSNAIKYCPSGRIDVALGCRQQDSVNSWFVQVRDTGPGVAEADRERIFETFRQLDGFITRKEGGVGLGLSISRQLATVMGGSLTLDRLPPGSGASFTLSLPLQVGTPPLPATPPLAEAPDSLNGNRILIVEDNATNRLVAASAMEQLGLDFDEARDGHEALACLRRQRYGAVLMDCQMPGMDGLEATRRWRAVEAAEGLDRTPIIALTANAVAGDAEDCLAAGMDAYLSKPYTFARLSEALGAHVAPPSDAPPREAGRAKG